MSALKIFKNKSALRVVLVLFVSFLGLYKNVQSQNLIIQGRVSDLVTEQNLEFTVVTLNKKISLTTDSNGFFRFKTNPGKHTLKVNRVGYRLFEINFEHEDAGIKNFKIELEPFENTLEQFVVAGSRENKRVSREITSINIIKPYLIESTNSTDLSQVVNRLPGVQVVDGQATIRGGAGYSYNTGSRVAVLLDDMPLLGADVGDVQWKFLPIEAAEQIEVIKGSASVLYGSSALNGTINVRTGWPSKKPQTKIQSYQGVMQNFERGYINWWEASTRPFNNGILFSHKQTFGKFDLVLSGNLSATRSHLQFADDFIARMYIKTRYRPTSIPNLTFGLNANMMFERDGRFFLWADADTGSLKQFNASKPIDDVLRITSIDPHIDYKHGIFTHDLKFRFYQIEKIIDKKRFPLLNTATANLYTMDYNNRAKINKYFSTNSGIYASMLWAHGIYYKGRFGGGSIAGYSQLELTLDKFNFILGGRYESFAVDKIATNTGLLKRIGFNYAAAEKTFLRFNYSEGYRNPTIAEKYTQDNVSLINIIPNPTLIPEKGWTSEIGIQQGFKIANFVASADMAFFVQQYKKMIEFKFDQWTPAQIDTSVFPPIITNGLIGFKGINIGNTRIAGFEISLTGEGKIGDVMIRTIMGYTYSLPMLITVSDSAYDKTNNSWSYFQRSTSMLDEGNYCNAFLESLGVAKISNSSSLYQNLMSYRNRRLGKFDLELTYRKYSLGYTMFYYSIYEKVDEFVMILPGVKDFFNRAGNADLVHNLRFAFHPNKNVTFGFLVNNVTNREYATRPGKLDPARTFIAQIRCNF